MQNFDSNAPRSIVRVNGVAVIPKNWRVERTSDGALDTAEVVLPIKGHPDWNAVIKAGQALEVRVYAGFPRDPDPGAFSYRQLSQRFAGTADPIQATFDPDRDECTFTCHDFGSILARTKTTTNLGATGYNLALDSMTTTAYIKAVAATHNFTVDIQPPGFQGATIKQVMAHEQIVGVHPERIWDLMKLCADTDGMYLWTHDGVIHYVDADALQRPYIYLEWMKGIASPMTCELQHSPQFAKDVEVQVRSYIPRQRVAHRVRIGQRTDSNGNTVQVFRESTSTAITRQNFGQPGSVSTSTEYFDGGTSNGSTSSGSFTSTGSQISTGGPANSGYTSTPTDSTKTKYLFTLPNATLPAAQKFAMAMWKKISAHEYTITFTFPVIADRLPNLDITTKYVFDNLPWPSGNHAYITKRLTENYTMVKTGQGGYFAEVIGINHRLPMGAV